MSNYAIRAKKCQDDNAQAEFCRTRDGAGLPVTQIKNLQIVSAGFSEGKECFLEGGAFISGVKFFVKN